MLTDPTQFAPLTDVDEALLVKWTQKAEIRLNAALIQRGTTLEERHTALPDVVQEVVENAVLRVLKGPAEGVSPLDGSANIWFPTFDLDMLCPPRVTVGVIRAVPRFY